MHYLIFLPNKQASNQQHLRDAGLGDLLRAGDESPLCADLIGVGPGDLPGQVWSWGRNTVPAYLPDRQTWTADKLGRYWVGITDGQPPTPQDLLRKNPVEGLPMKLADGNEWVIPNVLRLPMVFDLGDDDQPVKTPHPRFSWFVDEAAWALEAILEHARGGSEPDWKRALSFCAMALGINYRVDRSMVIRLGLLDENLMANLMARTTDAAKIREVIEDLQKKVGA